MLLASLAIGIWLCRNRTPPATPESGQLWIGVARASQTISFDDKNRKHVQARASTFLHLGASRYPIKFCPRAAASVDRIKCSVRGNRPASSHLRTELFVLPIATETLTAPSSLLSSMESES